MFSIHIRKVHIIVLIFTGNKSLIFFSCNPEIRISKHFHSFFNFFRNMLAIIFLAALCNFLPCNFIKCGASVADAHYSILLVITEYLFAKRIFCSDNIYKGNRGHLSKDVKYALCCYVLCFDFTIQPSMQYDR